jgi:thymidine phosphorylase
VGLFKINQMPEKKDVKETARLTIICNNKEQCTVKTKGDMNEMTAALACLMDTNHEDNKFREMMAIAIQLIITEHEMKEKKAAKKKSNPKQMDGVKSKEPFVKTRKKSAPKKK